MDLQSGAEMKDEAAEEMVEHSEKTLFNVKPLDHLGAFITRHVMRFTKAKGKWGLCSATHRIHLSNGRSRDADLSFWGYPRCKPSLEEPISPGAIPDVVIQFSWRNKKLYEEKTINELMNLGLEEDHGNRSATHPALGYLIRVRFSKKPPLPGKATDMEGLDVYQLPHSTTVADAVDPKHLNAKHWRYVPGGREVFITIAPRHLGITGVMAFLCGEYRIRSSDVFGELQRYQQNGK